MLKPRLVINGSGMSAQLWKPWWRGGVEMPWGVLTLWWGVPPRLRLYYWRGRARHTAAKARPVVLDPVSRGTCTDCKAQDGPCHCGDTLGCTC